MLSHQEYTAWISVGGQSLETYAVETSPATNEVTCWVASEAGKACHLKLLAPPNLTFVQEFSVHCRDASATRVHTVGVFVTVDGQECGGVALYNTANSYRGKDTVSQSDVQVSDTTVKPFVFSAVRLTGIPTRYDFKYWLLTFDKMKTNLRICRQQP
jgi:hypothetical protein